MTKVVVASSLYSCSGYEKVFLAVVEMRVALVTCYQGCEATRGAHWRNRLSEFVLGAS